MFASFVMKTHALSSPKPLYALALIGLVSSPVATGFDCTKARSNAEKMICSTPALSEQDGALNRLYLWKLDSAPQIEKPHITADQKDWIAKVRDTCTTAECLGSAYDARIKALSSVKYDGGTATYVADAAQIARISAQMQESLRKVGVTQPLGACAHVLSLDSHPSSYGAFCSLGSQKQVEMCYENMAGNLAVNFYGFSLTGSGLAKFTQSVCPGG